MLATQEGCLLSLLEITQRRMAEATAGLEWHHPTAVLDSRVQRVEVQQNQEVAGLQTQEAEVVPEAGVEELAWELRHWLRCEETVELTKLELNWG